MDITDKSLIIIYFIVLMIKYFLLGCQYQRDYMNKQLKKETEKDKEPLAPINNEIHI